MFATVVVDEAHHVSGEHVFARTGPFLVETGDAQKILRALSHRLSQSRKLPRRPDLRTMRFHILLNTGLIEI